VPIHEDEQFEHYLKQFQPLAPEALPARKYRRVRSAFVMTAWAATAAIVIIALLLLHLHAPQSSSRGDDDAPRSVVDHAVSLQPLTIQSVNAMLNNASSFKAAVDALAVPSHTPLFDGKQSALDVLGKE
jgi:hypothetical protein